MNTKLIIQRVAFAERCNCGLHGHINYPDGSQSLEFSSYDDGIQILEEAVQQKKIMEDNAMMLREEIAGWMLFKDRVLSFLRNMLSSIVAEGQPPEMIDKFLEELDRYVSIVFEEYFPENGVIYFDETSEKEKHTLH
ncbi:MAG: hypothetical protein Q7S11_00495 [bacterium]|nr:hypothetical protein [bacterium]